MLIAFVLSMPNVGSWNGRWSGDGDVYAVVEPVGRSKKAIAKAHNILSQGSYHYNFGDGWAARVSIKEVTAAEARKLRAASQGFAGYEWMIKSIKDHGRILPTPPRKKGAER